MVDKAIAKRVRVYAKRERIKIVLKHVVGAGQDGIVLPTNRNSVLKAIDRERTYDTELRCYLRLRDHDVRDINGLAVPQLLNHSDDLRIIELSTVQPPYLLDFGKAYLDEPAPYSQDQRAEFERDWPRFFRKADVPRVRLVLRTLLLSYGIDYVDPKPANIRLRSDADDRDADDWDANEGENYDDIGHDDIGESETDG